MTLALGILLTAALLLGACGSTYTVDSTDVPVKEGTGPQPSEEGPGTTSPDATATPFPTAAPGAKATPVPGGLKPVQDIHQRYSLTYAAKDDRTHALAQFRVRGELGDTIRFSKPSQVRFAGSPLRKVDGADVNAAVTLLNHLTVLPIFSLFRTGTFYTAGLPGRSAGTFEFEDDYGNKASLRAEIPEVMLTTVPSEVPVKAPTSPFRVEVAFPRAATGASLECSLQSRYFDAEGHERTGLSSTRGTIGGAKGTCAFDLDNLKEHAAATTDVTLKVEYSVASRALDAAGRTMDLRTGHVIERSLAPR